MGLGLNAQTGAHEKGRPVSKAPAFKKPVPKGRQLMPERCSSRFRGHRGQLRCRR